MTSGVSQGSVLYPLLFILYINDITHITAGLSVNLKLFANDAKLYSSFRRNSSFSADLMTACDNLKEWADTWQLQIASEKCLMINTKRLVFRSFPFSFSSGSFTTLFIHLITKS